MIPGVIVGANKVYGPPKGWTEEQCSNLAVRIEDGCCLSAWVPAPEELEALNRGGAVLLTVYGGQPPVKVEVAENAIQKGTRGGHAMRLGR